MPKKKRTRKRPNPRLPDQYLPDIGSRWPRIAKELHREIWSFGCRGCWESDETLARVIDCSRRSVIYARQLLQDHQAILCFRTPPRTWSMWAAAHPAVKMQRKLYFKGGSVPNPVYVRSHPLSR